MDHGRLIHELTLMLIYLSSWKEKSPDGDLTYSRKSYDEDVIKTLCDEGLISATHKAECVRLTEEGERRARRFAAPYGAFADMIDEIAARSQPISNVPAFEFRIDLELAEKRPCWRQVVVPADRTFAEFHDIIQSCFLWWNYHLYDFKLRSRGKQLEITDPEQNGIDAMFSLIKDSGNVERTDAHALSLDKVFPRSRTARYSYDYGDGWEHRIKLVRTISCYEGEMPVCTDGAGDAPPEDVGGAWGFEDFLRVIADESNPEHEDLSKWGKSQGFEHFSLDAVNRRMAKWHAGELIAEWDETHGIEQ